MDKFRIITFYTENYYEYFSKFLDSLDKFNLSYFFEMLNGNWEWKNACNYKPTFILKCLNEFSTPLIWIDCDAVIHSNLDYFDGLIDNTDIAFYFRDNRELLSGTLFFNNTENAKEVLKVWEKESLKIDTWDQRNLQNALRKCKDLNLRISYLPIGYCYFDLLKNGLNGDKIHIEHFQASRKFNPEHPIYGKRK